MSFWQGFAQAFKDADAKRTEDRRIQEERQFAQETRLEDRKWQEEFFFKKLEAETASQRETMLLQGMLGSGGRRSGGSGGGGADDSTVSLEVLMRAHPEIDPELAAQLAPFPNAIQTVFESLTDKKTEWANARLAWSPEQTNNMIRDIVPDPEIEVTPERVREIADLYRVDPSAEVFPGGPTFGTVIAGSLAGERSATVILDPTAAPDPMKPEAQRLFRETAENRMKGYLTNQIRQLNEEFALTTDSTNRTNAVTEEESTQLRQRINSLEALLSQVEDGFLDEALSSEFGTRALLDLWNSGDRTEYQRFFPSFKPHFNSIEEAQAAFQSGFIKPGQSVMVLDQGTYRQGRF